MKTVCCLILLTYVCTVSNSMKIRNNIQECAARNLSTVSVTGQLCLRSCNCQVTPCSCKRAAKTCVCDGDCGPSCIRTGVALCPEPILRHGSFISSNNHFVFGTAVHYQCDNRFRMRRNATQTCQGDGTWSGAKPKCVALPLSEVPNIDFSECGLAGNTRNLNEGRILGGANANEGAWRWQAAIYGSLYLYQEPSLICSGSLISTRWVLSAAHCFVIHPKQSLIIYLGVTDRYQDLNKTTTQPRRVSQIIVHPHFKPDTSAPFDYDIALLQLDAEVNVDLHVGPICLPDPGRGNMLIPIQPSNNDRGILTGWGHYTRRWRDDSRPIFTKAILQQVALPIVSRHICMRTLQRFSFDSDDDSYKFTLRMFCAGYESEKIGSCRGDSGGPVVRKGRGNRWVQIGISSWGRGCGMRGEFDYFTHLPRIFDWVNSTTHGQNQIL